MSIFFVSDTHFGHANIIAYCKRPWIRPGDYDYREREWASEAIRADRIKENDDTIIENWNKVVKPGDIVYHLGDFAFCQDSRQIESYLRRLNGQVALIYGNHDKHAAKKANGFIFKEKLKTIKVGETSIVLCHFAMRVWDKSHFGSWNLYGHSHGRLPDDITRPATDVGVDRWGFKPVPFEELQAFMNKRFPNGIPTIKDNNRSREDYDAETNP